LFDVVVRWKAGGTKLFVDDMKPHNRPEKRMHIG
jgi:hypothetical protein